MSTWTCGCGFPGNDRSYCVRCGRSKPAEPAAPPPQPAQPAWDPAQHGQQHGQPYGQQYAQPYAQQYGTPYGTPYGQPPPAYGAWPPQYPPPPPRTWRDGPGPVVIAALLATLALFGALGVIAALDTTGEPDSRGRYSIEDDDAFMAVVDQLKTFVAEQQGAPFQHPVEIEALSDAAFRDLISGRSGDEELDSTLRGVGAGEDVAGAREQLRADGVLGVYDSDDDVLLLRGKSLSPLAQLVMVHELTHAWQDQHYDLERIAGRAENRDHRRAVQSLVEGDARRVEDLWLATQPESVQVRLERDTDRPGPEPAMSRAERSAVALLSFPYESGVRFARHVAATGGNNALAIAYRDPPTSTEQVLHPEKFLNGNDPPVEVAAPSPDGAVIETDVMGEAGLALVLGRGDVGDAERAAVRGWEGDAYATWRDDDGDVCTTGTVAMESRAARDRLAAALRDRAGVGTVRIEGQTRVGYEFCEE